MTLSGVIKVAAGESLHRMRSPVMHAEAFLTMPSSCDAPADGPDQMPLAEGVPSAYRVGPRGYS